MQGISTHRLAKNPIEQRFADAWAKINQDDRMLKYLLDRSHSERGDYQPSQAEQETAATVIQWLGSPVGQGFLESVLEK